MSIKTPKPVRFLLPKRQIDSSNLMQNHRLIGEVHQRLRHTQSEWPQSRAEPADKNQGLHSAGYEDTNPQELALQNPNLKNAAPIHAKSSEPPAGSAALKEQKQTCKRWSQEPEEGSITIESNVGGVLIRLTIVE